jgi:hypothetical protein
MNNRKLLAITEALRGKSLHDVDAMLRQHHLDPQERLAVKVQLAAGAAGHTVRAGFELATDRAHYRHEEADQRPRSEMQRLLDRVGVDDQRTYTEPELNELLAQAGITDSQQRLAIKVEAEGRGLTRPGSVADTMLEQLGIEGPLDLMALERLLDQRGVASVAARTCVRAELQQRGWLKSSGSRSMQASAERGTPLLDARGQPLTLKSRP